MNIFFSAVGQKGIYLGEFDGTKVTNHSCIIGSINFASDLQFESLDLLILNFTQLKIEPLLYDVPLVKFKHINPNLGKF